MDGLKVNPHKVGKSIFSFASVGVAFGLGIGVIEAERLSLTAKVMTLLAVLAIQWFIFKKGQSSAWASAHAWAQASVDIAIEVSNIARANAQSLALSYSQAIANATAVANNSMTVQLSDGALIPISSSLDSGKSLSIQEGADMGAMRQYADILQELQLSHRDSTLSDVPSSNSGLGSEDPDIEPEPVPISSSSRVVKNEPLSLSAYPSHRDFGFIPTVLVSLLRKRVARHRVGS